ncbi:MAG: 3-oxoacyl-ACP reductase FabG [Cellulosilyticaceae bacterium]
MNFSNSIVLVTGSSRGIGKAIALAFAKHHATVVLNSAKNKAQLLDTYEEFVASGYKVSYYFGNIADFKEAKKMYHQIYNAYGQYPDVLVNNAGISYTGLFTDTTPDIWSNIIQTNLHSAYNCSYLIVPHMIQNHAGTIINISSIWGNVGASCEVAYSTSKSALNGFTRSLAKELGPSNIRVNAIACGWIDTDMNAEFTDEDRENFVEEVPLCRIGTPTEVADTCLFLASSQSTYLTGQVITLDGGLL